MGGNLATINSAKENEWLTDNGFGGWIGLTDRENEGDWKWLSGEEVKYVNWYPGQPDNVGDEDYVGKGTGNLQWGDANNSGYGNGGAELDAITEIPYYQFGDSIYIELGNSSWEEAQANAEKLGGNLVSINSKEEQEFIVNTFASNDDGDNGKWIGLIDKDQEGQWEWISGDETTYRNWASGEPDGSSNYKSSENYAIFNTLETYNREIGIWSDVPGDTEISGIVEIKVGESIETKANLKVDPVNDAPVVTGPVDLGSMQEDGTIKITKADLLANSSDPDGDPLSIKNLKISEGQGNITVNDDGSWTFTPDPDWNGNVEFSYQVSDSIKFIQTEPTSLTTGARQNSDFEKAVSDGKYIYVPTHIEGSQLDGDSSKTCFLLEKYTLQGQLIWQSEKGIEMEVSGKNNGDKYRVKEGTINMVFRKIHGIIIEIFVEDFFDTGNGVLSRKYYSQQLDVVSLKPKTNITLFHEVTFKAFCTIKGPKIKANP